VGGLAHWILVGAESIRIWWGMRIETRNDVEEEEEDDDAAVSMGK
jgi:hypothetical protein